MTRRRRRCCTDCHASAFLEPFPYRSVVQDHAWQNDRQFLDAVAVASIGIAMFPGDAPDIVNLTRSAEQTARAAADAGGAQYKFLDEALNARAKAHVVLEAELRLAIQAEQLRLH